MEVTVVNGILVVMGTLLLPILISFLRTFVWKPYTVGRALRKQGILGPKPRIVTGNLLQMEAMVAEEKEKDLDPYDNDYLGHIYPHLVAWSRQYGSRFLVWWGDEAGVIETDPKMVKEVLFSKYDGDFGKYSRQEVLLLSAIGQGLTLVNEVEWFHRRNLVQPAFSHDKLKGMVNPIITSTLPMLERWESVAANGTENTVEVAGDINSLSSDIIARVAFKSDYEQSKSIFIQLMELIMLTFSSIAFSFLPGFKYFPTKTNLRKLRLHGSIDKNLRLLVKPRMMKVKQEKQQAQEVAGDLMDLLLAANLDSDNVSKGYSFTEQQLMDELKSSFAAGFDTTSANIIWTLLLLAQHPEWQEHLYTEIQEVCGSDVPNYDSLNKLKIMTMVLNESFRLYPPAPQLARMAIRDTKVGNLLIPAGASVYIPFIFLQRDKELWGQDANEFRPERFEEGLASSMKHPQAWMPFGAGPRACPAKPFALMQSKIVVAMIVQKFQVRMSKDYRHNPMMVGVVLRTSHGMPMHLLRRANNPQSQSQSTTP